MSQITQIKDILSNGQWVCSVDLENAIVYIRDLRKRLSEIKREMELKGYKLESIPCAGFCGRQHNALIHKYRLVVQDGREETLDPLQAVPNTINGAEATIGAPATLFPMPEVKYKYH